MEKKTSPSSQKKLPLSSPLKENKKADLSEDSALESEDEYEEFVLTDEFDPFEADCLPERGNSEVIAKHSDKVGKDIIESGQLDSSSLRSSK